MAQQRLSDRNFGFMFSGVFLLVFVGFWLIFEALHYWLIFISLFFLLSALVYPGLLLPLNRIWHRFAQRLAAMNNVIILGLFYILIMCPMGLLMRLFRQDPMHRRIDPETETFFTAVERQVDSETLRDVF